MTNAKPRGAAQADDKRKLTDQIRDFFADEGADMHREDNQVWRRVGVAVLLAIVVGILTALGAGVAFANVPEDPPPATPWVMSDLDDYPPGALVTLTGGDWQPGEAVHIFVDDDSTKSWIHDSDPDPVADDSGSFTYSFELPYWFVANYKVYATGGSSGNATATFTDAVLPARGCAAPSAGNPIVVDATTDEFDSNPNANGLCSLREAIVAANADTTADSISLPSGSHTLTRSGTGEDINARGDLDVLQPVTITGAGARTTFIQSATPGGTPIDRVFHVNSAGTLTLSDVTVRNGRINDDGGGIKVSSGRSLTLTDVTVSGNTATDNKKGGGIHNEGTLVMERVTVSGNSAAGTGAGGGVWTSKPAALTNVTISDNTSATGAGIRIDGETTTFTNVTVSNNTGVGISSTGTATLRNTIVADNTVNCAGSIGNAANNLDSGATCGFTTANSSKSNVAAQLGSLQDNGGPTDTRALASTSPARDAGTATGAPDKDQRGIARPQGSAYDIGAFEVEGAANELPVITAVDYSPTSPTTNQTITATPTATDADGDSVTFTYQWQERVGLIWTNVPSATIASLDLTTAGRDKEDVFRVQVTPNDGTADGTRFDAPEITIANSAPVVTNVAITETNPDTDDVIHATYDDDDADGDTLTPTYSWFNDGNLIAGESGSSLDLGTAGNGDKGDDITVNVSVSDGTDTDDDTSAARTVANSAPVVTNVAITETNPDTDDVIHATYDDDDADGDTLTPTYTWFKNDVEIAGESGSSLDLGTTGNGDKGDDITVNVSVSDGTDTDDDTSAARTIANSAPVVTGVDYSPTSPTTGQTITATPTASDPDGDESTFSYQWQEKLAGTWTDISGAETGSLDLSVAGRDKGDMFRAQVTANDGADDSAEFDGAQITVADSAPEMDSVAIDQANPDTDDLLTVTASGHDDDGETVTYSYRWFKNGNPIAGESGSSLNLATSGNGSKGDDISVEVTPIADSVNGDPLTSDDVTIVNSAPVVSFTSGPTASNEGSQKTYVYSVTDADADTFTVTTGYPRCGTGNTLSDETVSATGGSFKCTFVDGDSTPDVKIQVEDSDSEASNEATRSVRVSNVAPTADAGGPYSQVWGVAVSFDGTASSDPAGAADTLSYAWDFDYDGTTFNSDATGASPSHTYSTVGNRTVALRVSDEDGGTSTVDTAAVSIGKHTTSLVYSGHLSKQYSDVATLTATLTDTSAGGTAISGKTVSFNVGSQNTTAVTNGSGVATTTLKIDQTVGSKTLTANFDTDALYAASSDSETFTVNKEDAFAYYTGALFASTSSATSSTGTVTLSATVKDVTAESPLTDADAGDIRNASVTFINRDTNANITGCANLTPGLVNSADTKVGTVTCNWSASTGSGDSSEFTIGVVVNGRYERNASTDNAVVTLAKPLGTNFITGGGFLMNQSSAGLVAGGVGQKTNFGFNVKYNKSGTSLQGRINVIVRNAGRVYQVKGNSMTSLKANNSNLAARTALFNGKASITDITDPLSPISLGGNATLQVAMTDRGEPGSADSIGITVWNGAGGLWFSSNWDSIRTLEQVLGGGNLVVR